MTKKEIATTESLFLHDLHEIVRSCRQMAYSSVNFTQILMNWQIGRRIVVQEQGGEVKAQYGKYVIRLASEALTKDFGKVFSESNIKSFRKFYIEFIDSPIGQTLSAESVTQIQQTLPKALAWSHYERLMRVENLEARAWYIKEAEAGMWSFRTLDRNISTDYYGRMLISQVKDDVRTEMLQKASDYQSDKLAFIKSPTVLEFLGLPPNSGCTESTLEHAILDNIQQFLMELGKGFALVARQQLIRTEARDYFIDLTFYNYILKCFFLVDLKIGRITHQDVGQMDMYVRMFDELKRGEGDNPTIGIVLCAETDPAIARYSILKGNEQIFASKYQLVLPTPEELQKEVNRQTELIRTQLGFDESKNG